MADDIQPALTREEWAKLQRGTPHGSAIGLGRDISVELDEGELVTTHGQEIPASSGARLMALGNRILPADHPLKITREDVTMLRQMAIDADDEWGCGDGSQYQAVALVRLADKLAALLPPEK